MTGINYFWIIDSNIPLLNTIDKLNKKSLAKSIETFDFTTLYTNLKHEDILSSMKYIIEHSMREFNLKIVGNRCLWTKDVLNVITKEQLYEMVEYVVNNTYFRFGALVIKQTVGIPMGTDCAPQIANLVLHYYEYQYIQKIKNDKEITDKLRYTFRYIDDITLLNDMGKFKHLYTQIYPQNLELKKVNHHIKEADVLDLNVKINNKKFIYETYDKRRNFNFEIVNFPHIKSNISKRVCYNVFENQIARHFNLNYKKDSFITNIRLLYVNLINRGYSKIQMRHIFHKWKTKNSKELKNKYKIINNIRLDLT